MPARVLIVSLALQLACLWGHPTLAAEAEPALRPLRVIPVDDDVWPYFNWASFDQDKLVSFGDHQYTIYWDADKVLVVVRRDLRSDAVQAFRLPQHTLTIAPTDGHRNTVLGISPGDGRLHLSWDHHNNDLRYTKTRAGFLSDPPVTMSPDDFEPAQPLVAGAPQSVTYPRFFNDADDNLFLMYRSGGSGNGETVLSRYDARRGEWEILSRRLFGKAGTYAPWNNSPTRNAYFHDVLFDRNNRLHVTWVYREVSGTWASNHDLHYAYSDDRGLTWMNNDGLKIADLPAGDPIVLDDPGIVAVEIPVYSWLMNACAMTLDSKNQPHVALYRMEKPFVPEKLEHNPPASVNDRLTFYHYWRDAQGGWHTSGPLDVPDHSPTRVKRPNIVVDRGDTVYLYWPSPDGFRCHVARPEDGWTTWSTFLMTGPELTANDASKHDRRLLEKKGILSFTADPNAAKGGKGYAILDFDLDQLSQAAQRNSP
jgi:hypothetical protein